PASVEVRRVPSGEPLRLKRFLTRAKLMRLAQFLFYPAFMERQSAWVRQAIEEGERVLRQGGADLVYTCSGPYCSNRIGLVLSRRFGVPWVADHRDPWTQSWGLHWPSRLHHAYCATFENEVLRRCSRFVTNTPGQREDLLRRFPSADPDRIVTIPNGYDEEDFAGPPPPKGERFVILHAGSFSDRSVGGTAPLGGPVRRLLRNRLEYRNRDFDLSAHSPAPVFRALALLRAGHPEFFTRAEFRLVGRVSGGWRGIAASLGVADAVRLTGPLPHEDAVREMRGADLLFAPEMVRRSGGRVGCTSQKLYEYLRAGPPVLATGGSGDTQDVIRETGSGWSFEPGDASGISDFILRSARGETVSGPRRSEVIARFDRRRLSSLLAETFRGALGEGRRP
ncbi:MAG: glycosyltransferase, partial [Planctomycetes bacterium]|nr:glycosyltransferase [Planctomycetota bacterium]